MIVLDGRPAGAEDDGMDWHSGDGARASAWLGEARPYGFDDRGVEIHPVSSIRQLPSWYFDSPTWSALLPPFSKAIAFATGFPARPILLKKNVVERNRDEHPEIKSDVNILTQSLYHATTVVFDRPEGKPFYRVIVRGRGRWYPMATIDLDRAKRFTEAVDWRLIKQERYNEMLRAAIRNKGDIQEVIGAWD